MPIPDYGISASAASFRDTLLPAYRRILYYWAYRIEKEAPFPQYLLDAGQRPRHFYSSFEIAASCEHFGRRSRFRQRPMPPIEFPRPHSMVSRGAFE